MPVFTYRVDDFNHTHERQAFRKVLDVLRQNISDHSIYVLGNATIPAVTYRNPRTGRVQSFKDVNPDIIIFKYDAIIVVEMKSYPGVIDWPTDQSIMYEPWFYEWDGAMRVINEGRSSPLSQVDSNSKALTAFLQTYENDLCDSDCTGSDWDKTRRILLFTDEDASFKNDRPRFWWHIYPCLLRSEDPGIDFAKVVEDITTPHRDHREDPRPQVMLNEDSILKILDILGASSLDEPSPERTGKELVEFEEQFSFSEYGLATVLVGSREKIFREGIEQPRAIAPQEGVSEQPLPIRLARYYAYCLSEEAKRVAQLDLSRVQDFCMVKSLPEPFFFGNGTLPLDDGDIPNSFLLADARLVYGYYFIVGERAWGGHRRMCGEPLFMTDIRIDTVGRTSRILRSRARRGAG